MHRRWKVKMEDGRWKMEEEVEDEVEDEMEDEMENQAGAER